jgi:hypothetical protein
MKSGRRHVKSAARAEPFFRHHCRCAKCGRRVVLSRHPEQYRETRPCTWCGGRLRVDQYRMGKERAAIAATTCNCGSYPFPHARARGRCLHNPAMDEHAWEDMVASYRAARARL